MDLPELERLAALAIADAPGDLQIARSKFTRLAIRDPQAVFVMSDEATRKAIAEEWFNLFAKRSPQGEGKANGAEPEGAKSSSPSPNNSAGGANVLAPSMGQRRFAHTPAETSSALTASLNVPEAGQIESAVGAEPQPAGGGQPTIASMGPVFDAPGGRPQSEGARIAMFKARAERAVTLFDTLKMHDGKAIGDVAWKDLPRYENAGFRQAWLCRSIYKHAVPANPLTPTRDLINLAGLQRLQQRSAEMADAA